MSAGADSIAPPRCPWLIVQGEADEVVDCRAVEAFAARFQPPPQLRLLPGAGHFFHRRLPELRDAAFGFLAATEGVATASRLETKKPGKA